MNHLNLLPKEPLIRRLFIPLLFLMIVIWVTMAGLLVLIANQIDRKTAALRSETAELELRLLEEQSKRQTGSSNRELTMFSETVNGLKQPQRNWVPVLLEIQSGLPPDARMMRLQAEDQNLISGDFIFPDMEEVASYLSRLQQNPLFERVDIRKIVRTENGIVGNHSQGSVSMSGQTDPAASQVILQVAVDIQLSAVTLPSGGTDDAD